MRKWLATGTVVAAAVVAGLVPGTAAVAAPPKCEYTTTIHGNKLPGTSYDTQTDTKAGLVFAGSASNCWVRIQVWYQIQGSTSRRLATSQNGYDNFGRYFVDGWEVGRSGSSVRISTLPGPEYIIYRISSKWQVYAGPLGDTVRSTLIEECNALAGQGGVTGFCGNIR